MNKRPEGFVRDSQLSLFDFDVQMNEILQSQRNWNEVKVAFTLATLTRQIQSAATTSFLRRDKK